MLHSTTKYPNQVHVKSHTKCVTAPPVSAFRAKMIDSSIDMVQKSYENRYLLLISGLIFTILCLIGALQMRKRKKTGYYYYLVGELAPIVLMAGLFGASFFGAIALLFAALISVIFVILYSTQLKHLS